MRELIVGEGPVRVLVVKNPQLNEWDRWREALEPLVKGQIAIVSDTQMARAMLNRHRGIKVLILDAYASPLPDYTGVLSTQETIRFLTEKRNWPDSILVVHEGILTTVWAEIRREEGIPGGIVTVLSRSRFFDSVGSRLPDTVIRRSLCCSSPR